MSFTKRTYKERETVITAENLNDIQDELIRLGEVKYEKPEGGIPKTDLDDGVKTSLGKADTALQEHQPLTDYRTAAAQDEIDAAQNTEIGKKYEKPEGGIPKTDLAAEVKTSLGKADTALQEHQPLTDYRTAAAQDVIDALLGSTILGTTQTVTFDANGKPQRIVHTANNAAVRTDVFTWGENSVTELRTLANGKHITITTNLTTLETVITGIEEAA